MSGGVRSCRHPSVGHQDKDLLRRRFLLRRQSLGEELATFWSRRIAARLFSMKLFQEAEKVSFYSAVRGEVKTAGMVEASISMGKRVAFPRVDPITDEIVLYWVEDPQRDLALGTFRIPEPLPVPSRRVLPGEVDLFLVPGLVFDHQGYRLGYGKGYYDRLLSNQKGTFVGLAYEFQIVPACPKSRKDVKMDAVVTEKRVIETGDFASGA